MPDVAVEVVGQNGPVSGPTDTIGIDFSALKAKAKEMLDASEAAQAVNPPKPEEILGGAATNDPTKVRVKGSQETKVEQPVQAKPEEIQPPVEVEEVETSAKAALAIGDDDLVEVTVDGQTQVLPWKEARGKISGGLKFTQNMQQLAKERDEFKNSQEAVLQLQRDRQSLLQLVNNRDALAQYAAQAFGLKLTPAEQAAVAAQVSGNPDELATLGETQSLLEQRLQPLVQLVQTLQQNVQQQIQTTTADIENRQQTAKHAVVLDATLQEIFKSNPVLTAIPNAEDLIRYNVALLKPATEAEAVEAFRTVANGIVEEIGKHNKQVKKAQAIAAVKQKLETHSIEPVGGAPVQVQPTSFKNKDGQVDWNKVRDLAAASYGNNS